jgi:hypothetical protein
MRAALVSLRMGAADGVSVEAATWGMALRHLGWTVSTVAGAGGPDAGAGGPDDGQRR